MTAISWSRPLAALATIASISALLLIATWSARRPASARVPATQPIPLTRMVEIELTIAGALAEDGFSLAGANGLRVWLDGVLLIERGAVKAETLRLTRDVATGEPHAVTFEAAVEAVSSAAVRVRVTEGSHVYSERSWWSESGEPLAGELTFSLAPSPTGGGSHGHD